MKGALTLFKSKNSLVTKPLKEIPADEQAILEAANRARKLVTKRAMISAGASVLPLPGVDAAVDVSLLLSILNAINEEFGLTPQQIQHLSTDNQIKLFQIITVTGSSWIGCVVTKNLVVAALKKMSIQLTAAQAAKWLPIAGQAAAAGLSFAALKWIGSQHIQDCCRVARIYNEEGLRRSSAQFTSQREG